MEEVEIFNTHSLDEISKLVSKCTRCSLYKTKKNDVPGVGNSKAEILFIGEAPGKEEDIQGEPFVGAAGKFLNEMLSEINLERSDIYIANVLKHRPPDNRDPRSEEAQACWPFLQKQIEIIDPLLIVFLGRHSMNRFFPNLKISEVHGKAFTKELFGEKKAFMALYHPAAALYNGGLRKTLMEDFSKIPRVIQKIKGEKTKLIILEN